jgi:hypothetical protein
LVGKRRFADLRNGLVPLHVDEQQHTDRLERAKWLLTD